MLVSMWKKIVTARMIRAAKRSKRASLGFEPLEDRSNPATTGIIATTVEFGVSPVVSVFNSDGTPKFTVQAFESTFLGGVRVAVGDVNGDDTADLIAGAGIGGGAVVKVFSGVDGQELRSFFAGDETNRGGATVAAGDFDNDGDTDIIIGAVRNGEEVISVQDGGTGQEIKTFTPFGAAIQGVNVAAGDYNGDKTLDIAVGAGILGGPRVSVIDGATGELLLNTFAFEENFHGGVQVGMGDLDGDGKAEVAVAAGPLGGPRVVVYHGGAGGLGGQILHSFFAYENTDSARNGVQVSIFDINADNTNDIITAAGPGQAPNVRAFDGVTLEPRSVPGQFNGLPYGQLADEIAPSAVVRTTADDPTNVSPIPFMVTFSEDVTGFTAADVTVAGGTVTDFAAVDARTYTFGVEANADGTVTVSVAAGVATDAAGNPNTAAAPVSLVFDAVDPAITGLAPTEGPTAGGTVVTITGSGFTAATDVAFGATSATSFTVDSDTQITATTPAGTAGLVDVSVTTPGGTDTELEAYTYVAAPTIAGLIPTAGPTAGGTLVTITGTGLTGATSVTFGGTPATSFTVVSDTQIAATSPAAVAGPVDVAVSTVGGAATAVNAYTYVAAPTITALSPTAGPTAGGTVVTITGTGFTGATTVTFGGTPAASFTVDSGTQITATAPAGAAGTVDVSVTTIGGASANTAADDYTYVAAPTIAGLAPTAGPTAGGTAVTITGTGLTGATSVTFGGTPATSFTVVSDTQIVAISPAATAGAVDVAVSTVGGTATAAGAYTYVAAPTITSLSPSQGPETGGTAVTITGTGFTGASSVSFAGTPATSFTVVSDTQIVATAPVGTAGSVDVTVATTGGISADTAADNYTYVAAPTITTLSPTAGPTAGGNSVTITGTGFTTATTVSFGGIPTAFAVVSDTQIVAISPAGTVGTVDVSVTTVGGSATASSAYTYAAAPTIATLTPTAGPTAGGATITITGTGFTGATSVSFRGTPAVSFTVVSDTQITATAPASAAGPADVSITTPGGTATAVGAYTYVAAPTITALNPTAGSTAGGNSVTITGSGFTTATGVSFGGTLATAFTVVSDTQIVAAAPAGAAGTVDVSVTTFGGTATAVNAYTYVAPPTITALSPTAGPTSGGTAVTITGTAFTTASSVSFGGTPTSFTVISDTQIVAISPAGTAGSVDVVVTTDGGTATAVGAYTYVAPPGI